MLVSPIPRSSPTKPIMTDRLAEFEPISPLPPSSSPNSLTGGTTNEVDLLATYHEPSHPAAAAAAATTTEQATNNLIHPKPVNDLTPLQSSTNTTPTMTDGKQSTTNVTIQSPNNNTTSTNSITGTSQTTNHAKMTDHAFPPEPLNTNLLTPDSTLHRKSTKSTTVGRFEIVEQESSPSSRTPLSGTSTQEITVSPVPFPQTTRSPSLVSPPPNASLEKNGAIYALEPLDSNTINTQSLQSILEESQTPTTTPGLTTPITTNGLAKPTKTTSADDDEDSTSSESDTDSSTGSTRVHSPISLPLTNTGINLPLSSPLTSVKPQPSGSPAESSQMPRPSNQPRVSKSGRFSVVDFQDDLSSSQPAPIVNPTTTTNSATNSTSPPTIFISPSPTAISSPTLPSSRRSYQQIFGSLSQLNSDFSDLSIENETLTTDCHILISHVLNLRQRLESALKGQLAVDVAQECLQATDITQLKSYQALLQRPTSAQTSPSPLTLLTSSSPTNFTAQQPPPVAAYTLAPMNSSTSPNSVTPPQPTASPSPSFNVTPPTAIGSKFPTQAQGSLHHPTNHHAPGSHHDKSHVDASHHPTPSKRGAPPNRTKQMTIQTHGVQQQSHPVTSHHSTPVATPSNNPHQLTPSSTSPNSGTHPTGSHLDRTRSSPLPSPRLTSDSRLSPSPSPIPPRASPRKPHNNNAHTQHHHHSHHPGHGGGHGHHGGHGGHTHTEPGNLRQPAHQRRTSEEGHHPASLSTPVGSLTNSRSASPNPNPIPSATHHPQGNHSNAHPSPSAHPKSSAPPTPTKPVQDSKRKPGGGPPSGPGPSHATHPPNASSTSSGTNSSANTNVGKPPSGKSTQPPTTTRTTNDSSSNTSTTGTTSNTTADAKAAPDLLDALASKCIENIKF